MSRRRIPRDGRRYRIFARRAGWADRSAGFYHHRLVPDARLDPGPRAVFQLVILTAVLMIAISLLSVAGAITIDTLKFYALTGLWLGFMCYGKLEDPTFRKLILVLLLCSGLALIAARRWPLTGLSFPGVDAWVHSIQRCTCADPPSRR